MQGTGRKRLTIRDVATVAGVSSGTVSRVLNGKNWVSPEARTAVEQAIRKTGYRVNPHARNLATSKSNTVAFLLNESQHVLFEDPNFAHLVRGTARALAALEVHSVLIMAGDAAEQARAFAYISAGHVDGVLLAFTSAGGTPLVERLVDAGVPLVSCGLPVGDFEGRLGSVAADDLLGATQVMEHLLERGHRRIATITGPADTPGGIARFEAYSRAVGDRFDERLVVGGDYSRAGGAHATHALLERTREFDAIFAANDAMAAGAIDALLEAGLRVPDDVAVAGFDDNDFATATDPQLTTVRQPFERISIEMVRLLMDIIGGEQPATLTLPTTLVVRGSA
ncbi:LacI family DNA-binding transcriptional regulator [Planctomonas psychrotolerans]|uniref:LacI family DNA-binding transcriptional regulator n=1 Tax=Planctomonas psychrotolerans TaxID=2528712 RepID=UPI00123AE284|nr:LacI family DNA-binding transcriptional regulator [Planctomonas psychrotolerans]